MSTMNKQNELGTESILKLLIKFSIPAIIGMVVNMLYNVVDRIYIGNIPNVGGLAITGVGITMPVTQIITAFGMLIGIGTCASISLSFGKSKHEEAQNYLGNGVTATLIISILIAILGNVFAEDILILFGASENTLPFALTYIRPLLLGTIFNLFAFGLNNSIRSDGNPKLSMFTMIIGALINIILDPLFIFTFGLGIQGAAFATVLSQFIASCWVLYYFTKSSKSSIKLTLKDMKFNLPIIKGIFIVGLSPFCMQVASSIVSVIANKSLMTYGGDLAIGAMAIITSISTIYIMPIYGLNQGAQPIIGYNYGAGNLDRVKKTYLYSLITATILLTLSFLFIETYPYVAVNMFNNDPDLTEITVSGMKLFLLSMPIIGIQMTASNYYQAVGKAKKAMVISLSRQVIFLIPCFLIIPKFLGLKGVWLAGPIADSLAILVSSIVIFREIHMLGKTESTSTN
ncbi:MAG: MATE family efflux transporter [Niameybacter sp.]|uniref:MATE family efflux transporter n=1 Tax=Niameybacter sp. TaxID=2033640 RepID=UPI002FCC9407